jgi:peptide chain release factor 1
MYTKFAARRGLKPEIMSTTPAEAGGFTDVTLGIKGENAWAQLKWESGVHRVQRVPQTETQGRIHTSTATVVVRAEVDPVEVEIDMNDVRVDVFRSSGPGGQSVNTTDSAVRLTHMPTGLVVSCQNEKSQHQNKDQALRVLRSRLYELEVQKQEDALSAHRRAAIGSGDRSEKIRTYNYPDKRVTDHRINMKIPQLDKVLAGEIDEFVEGLQHEERHKLLQEQLGSLK